MIYIREGNETRRRGGGRWPFGVSGGGGGREGSVGGRDGRERYRGRERHRGRGGEGVEAQRGGLAEIEVEKLR